MDIRLYKSKARHDGEFNGGYEDCTAEIVSGVYNNLFPDVSPSEHESGYTRYRKLFVHAVTQTLSETYLGILHRSPAGDYFRIHAATAGQTQGGLLASGSFKWYGTGYLVNSAAAGLSVLTVNFDEVLPDLAASDKILVADNVNNEMHVISAITFSGISATITLAEVLSHSYAENSQCCHLLALGGVEPSFSDWSESSSGGSYDESGHPPELYLIGTVEDNWTLTFAGATYFTCVGTTSGNLGTGYIAEDFSPTNPVGGTYFTILSAGWGGTWQNGDTVTFKTHPASKAAWVKEVIPAGSAASAFNETPLVVIYA